MRGNGITWIHWLVGMVCCALLWTACHADEAAEDTAVLDGRVADIRALIVAEPEVDEDAFSEGFLNQLPAGFLKEIGKGFFDEYGAVVEVRPLEVDPQLGGTYEFVTDKGFRCPVSLMIEADPPHRINTLWFSAGEPLVASLEEVVAGMAELPGRASLCVTRYDDDGAEQLAALNADTPLAIGSAFKLYVLAELVRAVNAGERQWSDVVELTSEAMSLPSGMLHTWPTGAPVTLQSLATVMIFMSGNTATDQLMYALGRENVEAILTPAGHSQPELNAPLLTTREFFALKAGPDEDLTDRYLAADEQARRELLAEEVAAVSRSDIRAHLLVVEPRYIDTVEWFASTADLGRVLIWLRDHSTSAHAGAATRDVLAVNPGLAADGDWSYQGYKGGSEAGVLNLSFLMQRDDGVWFTVVGTWNNAESVLNDTQFMGLIQAALRLVGEEDGEGGAE